MNVTIIGAGNSGLAMAAHMSLHGNQVVLWNRSKSNISQLMKTCNVKCSGLIKGAVKISSVTDNIEEALHSPDLIMITTPADSHKYLAMEFALHLKKNAIIILNPGRTFGVYEFLDVYRKNEGIFELLIAETQTIIYTCRKTGADSVNIIAFKTNVLISSTSQRKTKIIFNFLPSCIKAFFKPAHSIVETSIGNVGMVLHCAPMLLNSGWVECNNNSFKYYYDGITPSIGNLLEKIDQERVLVSSALGVPVETTAEWLRRTYEVEGEDIYTCIQNNNAYKTIEAASSLHHRYVFEDIPCGLVPLESIGKKYGLPMKYTSMVIDLAESLLNTDFRETGRDISKFNNVLEEMTDIIAVEC